MAFQWGRFSEKQLDSIVNSDARLNFWQGAVRSGKTIASIVRWLDFIASGPQGDLLMVGKTERTLKRNVLDTMAQILGPKRFKYNKGEGEVYVCGRRIYVVGANDERAEGKIRGMTLAGAYGDEVTLWPEAFFKMLLSRLSVPGAKFFGTTNPDSPYHWLKREYLEKPDLNLKSWHFLLEDNPNLDPEYVESLKKEYTGLWYKRFILGMWVQAEGAVYDMWDEDRHVVDEVPTPHEARLIYCGVDYGTTNPCAFLLISLADDTWYVHREYYHDSRAVGRQKTDAEYSRDLAEFLGDLKTRVPVVIDPSAASFKEQLQSDGFIVWEADNSVLDGIRAVATLLNEGRLKVHRSCQNLIREFSAYVWDEKAQKRGEDKPLKENDHALDALRYVIWTYMSAPQPNIRFFD